MTKNISFDNDGRYFILLHVAKLQQNDGNEPSQCCCFSLPVPVSVVCGSTETALLCVLSDILAAVDRGDFAALVLLDLSAAFNTVDHDILLQRLQTSFGIRNAALNWFCQFNLTYITRGRGHGLVFFASCGRPHFCLCLPYVRSLTVPREPFRAYKTKRICSVCEGSQRP